MLGNRHGLITKSLILNGMVVLIVAISALPATVLASEQDQKHDPILEKVNVTNVEVPVRVIHKGKPVTGLTKDDFVLYENKKKMDINGFFVKKKTIVLRETGKSAQTAEPVPPAPAPNPRTFVLVFNITSYNKEFQRALDYVFEKILKPADSLMIFANDQTRTYDNLKDKEKIKMEIVADLNTESQKAKRRLMEYITRLESYLKHHGFQKNSFNAPLDAGREGELAYGRALMKFLQKYLLAWTQYKKQYLTPRVDRFYYFSRYLETLKTEKWVLNFYQFEFFPRVRLNSQTMHRIREISSTLQTASDNPAMLSLGRRVDTLLEQINKEHSVNQGFPTEEIAKLFYKVDATFHSLFIRTQNPAFLQDFEYKTISSDIELTLKGITDITGGKNIATLNMVDALETVSDIEDTYYILTYVPGNPHKKGKLKIKLKNSKGTVLYDNNFRQDYINDYLTRMEEKLKTPDIKVNGFSFKRKNLAFTISDYMMRKIPDQPHPIGQMKVRIRIVDTTGSACFDSGKLLTATESQMKISIPSVAFKKIAKGQYNFLIDAQDMFTGKVDNFFQGVIVK